MQNQNYEVSYVMLAEYEFREIPIHVFKTANAVSEFPVKFHKQIELCYVLDGVLDVEIEGKKKSLNKGDVYLVFPNIPHAVFSSNASVLIAIIDGEIVHSYREILSHQKPKDPVITSEKLGVGVVTLFQQIHDSYITESPFRSTVLHSLFNALLGMLLNSCQTIPRNSENELIEKILIYFSDHFTDKITLDNVANEFNYSKYYISHIINDTLHCNFSTLLNSYRISLAQNLLISTAKSIGEIATECGFQNQSSFNRVFAKLVGVSPCKFRLKRERYANSIKESEL